MFDLIVVGGGFWGVAQALFAEAQGKRVLLIDTPRDGRASVVAAGLFSLRWFKGPMRALAKQALNDAYAAGVELRKTGADVITYKGERYTDVDLLTFNPHQFLSLRLADRSERVVHVSAGSVRTDAGDQYMGRRVVLCCGIYTDELLTGSGFEPVGVKPLWGSAVLLHVKEVPPRPLQVFTNPYAHYTVREWGNKNFVRVGETLEKRAGRREEYLNKMRTVMADHLVAKYAGGGLVVSGARPTLERGMGVLRVPDGPYVATGGGRSGAIMSFWAARLLDMSIAAEEGVLSEANQGA